MGFNMSKSKEKIKMNFKNDNATDNEDDYFYVDKKVLKLTSHFIYKSNYDDSKDKITIKDNENQNNKSKTSSSECLLIGILFYSFINSF
jgi:hypothetical protein